MLLGVVAVVDYARRLYLGRASRNWISTSGKVVRSRPVRVRRRYGGYTIANLAYEYSVHNVVYTGKAIGFREPLDSAAEDGDRLADRYPKGKAIRVWYDPERPTRAVLQPGTSRQSISVLLGWVVFTLFWAIFLYLAVRAT